MIASGAQRVTDEMFMTAAHTLAHLVTGTDLEQGSLPVAAAIREVSAHIAAEIAQVAYKHSLATGEAPVDELAHVRSHMYDPRY